MFTTNKLSSSMRGLLSTGGRSLRLLPSSCFSLRAVGAPEDLEDETPTFPKKVFSGIQPTGCLHLGNYLGAIRKWTKLQNSREDVTFCIADLHSITVSQEPYMLREQIFQMAATMLACGIDIEKSTLFVQSAVKEHTELAWILGCVTTMGRLGRLPQYTEKTRLLKNIPLGLFVYPVLQAADILLHKGTHVPIGEDQLHHVQLAQHVVQKFNDEYGVTFPKPLAMIDTKESSRIRSLRDPGKKMSKSDPDQLAVIYVLDEPEVIVNKLKRSSTDLISDIYYDDVRRPAVANLIAVHSLVTGWSVDRIVDEANSLNTESYKLRVADAVIEHLKPIRTKIIDQMARKHELIYLLETGAEKARRIAHETMAEIRQKTGLGALHMPAPKKKEKEGKRTSKAKKAAEQKTVKPKKIILPTVPHQPLRRQGMKHYNVSDVRTDKLLIKTDTETESLSKVDFRKYLNPKLRHQKLTEQMRQAQTSNQNKFTKTMYKFESLKTENQKEQSKQKQQPRKPGFKLDLLNPLNQKKEAYNSPKANTPSLLLDHAKPESPSEKRVAKPISKKRGLLPEHMKQSSPRVDPRATSKSKQPNTISEATKPASPRVDPSPTSKSKQPNILSEDKKPVSPRVDSGLTSKSKLPDLLSEDTKPASPRVDPVHTLKSKQPNILSEHTKPVSPRVDSGPNSKSKLPNLLSENTKPVSPRVDPGPTSISKLPDLPSEDTKPASPRVDPVPISKSQQPNILSEQTKPVSPRVDCGPTSELKLSDLLSEDTKPVSPKVGPGPTAKSKLPDLLSGDAKPVSPRVDSGPTSKSKLPDLLSEDTETVSPIVDPVPASKTKQPNKLSEHTKPVSPRVDSGRTSKSRLSSEQIKPVNPRLKLETKVKPKQPNSSIENVKPTSTSVRPEISMKSQQFSSLSEHIKQKNPAVELEISSDSDSADCKFSSLSINSMGEKEEEVPECQPESTEPTPINENEEEKPHSQKKFK